MAELCRHCNRLPAKRPRGLCWGCHGDRSIRRLYPKDPACGQTEEDYHEPTAEEIERMIAEQIPTLPPEKQERRGPRVSRMEQRIVRRGP